MQIQHGGLAKTGLEHGPLRSRWWRTGAGLACLALLSGPAVSGPQQITGPPHPTSIILPEANRPPDANDQMLMRERQVKKQKFEAANAARKLELDTDSANLLILAKDLNAQMQKLGDQPLPARLVREAEVIEILAHDVQTKMKLTTGAS